MADFVPQIRDGTSDILYRLNQQKFEVRYTHIATVRLLTPCSSGPRPGRGGNHQDDPKASLGYGGDFPKPDRLGWNALMVSCGLGTLICIRLLYSFHVKYISCRYDELLVNESKVFSVNRRLADFDTMS